MRKLVIVLIIALLILHQDNWFWNDGTLVFGFMPIGLFYHALLSLAAGITWLLAATFCWPPALDAPVDAAQAGGAGSAPAQEGGQS